MFGEEGTKKNEGRKGGRKKKKEWVINFNKNKESSYWINSF